MLKGLHTHTHTCTSDSHEARIENGRRGEIPTSRGPLCAALLLVFLLLLLHLFLPSSPSLSCESRASSVREEFPVAHAIPPVRARKARGAKGGRMAAAFVLTGESPRGSRMIYGIRSTVEALTNAAPFFAPILPFPPLYSFPKFCERAM